MEELRSPFQGVSNIIRFNWPFYIFSIVGIFVLLLLCQWVPPVLLLVIQLMASFTTLTIIISLIVSWYVYDNSGLYNLSWVNEISAIDGKSILNIHSGFDETSALIAAQYPVAQLTVLDFYNAQTHTEASIKRARKASKPYPGTMQVSTNNLPVSDGSVDLIFLMLAAHEIRNEQERILFFGELRRILKPDGSIYVVEHLRDTANFLAYSIGFLHFLSEATWLKTFRCSGLSINSERKHSPFISVFKLGTKTQSMQL